MTTTEATSAWTKLPPIEAHYGGCLNCGPRPAQFPPDGVIAVGFGYAALHKDGKPVWSELNDLAEAQQIDTVIVLGTLKAAPPAGALPPHIEAQWIERGAISSEQRIKEAA